ncbi:MAG: exodeoxyribonuclease VII small subunit [Lachnospiraceae bacterium]|nr:exodeoxyribonuclease VII small subunit [Lachnospiraceae bacterium]MDD7026223.1 exodeoxyribonuclease VII small subunit [Lachnospiraceae bacterium]MDY5701445.1 exodeoxyribonuclease VII small subunit [Lachnospiraceae bacterium]
MAKKKEERLTLEEALLKLDEAVAKLQSDEISLEDSFQVYQQGMEYVKFCSQTIDQVEKKVLMLNQEGGLDELEE